jgi:hypothetical protein
MFTVLSSVKVLHFRVFDVFSGCLLMISGRERAPAHARGRERARAGARKNLVFSLKLSGLCRRYARYYPLIPSMSHILLNKRRTSFLKKCSNLLF